MKQGKIDANISFSGGETSAFMTKWLLDNWGDKYNFVVTFANTGQELEETLEFVNKCDNYFGFNVNWVEAVPQEGRVGTKHKLVTFETASRSGEPFEAVIKKYGIPNMAFKHCSRELKRRPIESFAKSYFGTTKYQTFIGIRADEIDRMTSEKKLHYPLVDLGITKAHINTFWNGQPFRLNIKGYEGNCKVCWKKSKRKLMTIAREHPERFDFFQRMEDKYSHVLPKGKNPEKYLLPALFFRGKQSCQDIIKDSREEFKLAEDDKFIFLDESMDLEGSCGSETCEAY